MRLLVVLSLLFCLSSAYGQKNDEAQIRKLLAAQTEAWNSGNLEGFMQGYWRSDSLLFIGKSGVTRGWQKTLDNYKRGYPDTAAMGKLAFDILKLERLAPDHFFVVGKWMLQRTAGNLSGHYTLVLRKIKGQWVVVADHSS